MIWINHNSALILGIGILVLAAVILLRDGFKARDALFLAVLCVPLFLVWLALRPLQTEADQDGQLLAQIGAGLPVLLEIQSPY